MKNWEGNTGLKQKSERFKRTDLKDYHTSYAVFLQTYEFFLTFGLEE